jgi:sugar/nucleoside kinase (ribokinase family)
MKLGTLAAALKLQQQGSRAGQPTLQEVRNILDTMDEMDPMELQGKA